LVGLFDDNDALIFPGVLGHCLVIRYRYLRGNYT
jgi:hypothetical protein